MTRYTDGQLIERLEAMRAAAGVDCDWATELLDLIHTIRGIAEVGDEAYEVLAVDGRLVVGDDPMPYIRKLCQTERSLHDLAVSAGLIVPTDHKTDILPLIAMFLPIEG